MRTGKRGVCVAGRGRMNDRQKAFADYYIECGNATEAARRAGYSEKTARQMGAENLSKPYILEYIQSRIASAEQKRIATANEVMQFFTRVMDGTEKGVTMADRLNAGREILKRDISDKKLDIELLKLESQIKDSQPEEEAEDNFMDALNGTATEVWENSDNGGEVDG